MSIERLKQSEHVVFKGGGGQNGQGGGQNAQGGEQNGQRSLRRV